MAPPTVAIGSDHGSCPRISPSRLSACSSVSKMTPAWTRTVRFSLSISKIESIRFSSMTTEGRRAIAPPIRPEPPPYGTMAMPRCAANWTISDTSSVVRGRATTSGCGDSASYSGKPRHGPSASQRNSSTASPERTFSGPVIAPIEAASRSASARSVEVMSSLTPVFYAALSTGQNQRSMREMLPRILDRPDPVLNAARDDLAPAHGDDLVQPGVLRCSRLEHRVDVEVELLQRHVLGREQAAEHRRLSDNEAAVGAIDEGIVVGLQRRAHVELDCSISTHHRPVASARHDLALNAWPPDRSALHDKNLPHAGGRPGEHLRRLEVRAHVVEQC